MIIPVIKMNNCDSNFTIDVSHKLTIKAGTPTGNQTAKNKNKK
jgi:hypothetical protein